jgi:hypothetical protein
MASAKDAPPRILIYGPEKMGKTSLAAEFPNPVFLRVESGAPDGSDLMGWDINSYEDLCGDENGNVGAIGTLINEEHDFKTVVIDSTSSLESKVVWPHVCATYLTDSGKKAEHIEDFGFGKGYKYAIPIWEYVLDGLNHLRTAKGMTVVLIGHSQVMEFKDPEAPSYNVYDVALQNADKVSAAARIKREMDAILFIKQEVTVQKEDPKDIRNKRNIAQGGSARYICTEKRPAFSAGNRYGMPEKIPYPKGGGFEAIAKHIPPLQQYLVTTKKAA